MSVGQPPEESSQGQPPAGWSPGYPPAGGYQQPAQPQQQPPGAHQPYPPPDPDQTRLAAGQYAGPHPGYLPPDAYQPTPSPTPNTPYPYPPTGAYQQYPPTGQYQGYPPNQPYQQYQPAGQQPGYPPGGRPPITKQPWFLPVVAIFGVLVLGALIFGGVKLATGGDDDKSGPQGVAASSGGLSGGSTSPPGPVVAPTSPPAASGSAIPEAFLGAWSGNHVSTEMGLVLRQGAIGDMVGATSYVGYCTETLTLLEIIDEGTIRLHETASAGDPCSDADITLTIDSSGAMTLRYEEYSAENDRAWAYLSRTGGAPS